MLVWFIHHHCLVVFHKTICNGSTQSTLDKFVFRFFESIYHYSGHIHKLSDIPALLHAQSQVSVCIAGLSRSFSLNKFHFGDENQNAVECGKNSWFDAKKSKNGVRVRMVSQKFRLTSRKNESGISTHTLYLSSPLQHKSLIPMFNIS